jgi:hypothetical protein
VRRGARAAARGKQDGGDVTAAKQPQKRQFLVHLDAELIRRIKIMAINRKVTASSIVQAALLDFLAAQAAAPSRKEDPEC